MPAKPAFGMRCPRCRESLSSVATSEWCFFRCASCNGCAATIALVRRVAPQRVKDLWLNLPDGEPGDPCPDCARPLATVEVAVSGGETVHVDACRRCQLLWFDAKEIERFADSPAPDAAGVFSSLGTGLSPEAREATALAEIERRRDMEEDEEITRTSNLVRFGRTEHALSALLRALQWP